MSEQYLYDQETESYFKFNTGNWNVVGRDGTGRLGHYSTQGNRTIYASPRRTKSGLHRFVISGTGYYSSPTGGSDWGRETCWLSYSEAMERMDDDQKEKYLQRTFDTAFYQDAEIENTVPRGGRGTESLLSEYPQLVRVRYYKRNDDTRKTVEIEI